MWGAIIGDIVGSSYEFANHRSKFFELFRHDAYFTDDTVCTAAVADMLTSMYPDTLKEEEMSDRLRLWCCTFLNRGFGSMFYQWIVNGVNAPYKSHGNGSLMRISPVALFAIRKNIDKQECLEIAEKITNITHNHPQALLAVRVYVEILYDLMRNKSDSIEEKKTYIKDKLMQNYKEDNSVKFKTIDEYRVEMEFDVTAKKSLFVACQAIIESQSFEDTMYNVVSVGGDSDTYAAIAGAMAEVIFGIPEEMNVNIKNYFNSYDQSILNTIQKVYDINPIN